MKDINIAKTLSMKRREKGVTQDELARYLGVSKASVSKWETGTSYPDIAFLPQLATYFDISIDELIGYNPCMTKEQIRFLYQRLTDEITKRPLEETLSEWQETIKKYHTCYPLLTQLGIFMLNNISSFPDPEQRNGLIHETIGLFSRVREESQDARLSGLALKFEASCHLALAEPDMTLLLLEGFVNEAAMPPELLASSAYQMKGDLVEAKRSIQTGLFQNLVIHFNFLINYLAMVVDDSDAFDATIERARKVSEAYNLPELHPYLQLSLEFMCAVGYAMRGEQERCLAALEAFAKRIAYGKTPLDLHGDSYFNLVGPWFDALDTGTQLPRNVELVKHDFIDRVAHHPAFAFLKGEKRYQTVLEKLDRLKEDQPL